ncbi:hypothetical protein ABZ345_04355 [Lentzea sp. NPDC005914]|uniref:hypothetical protein n=1 Tax=Lentzea sp. NPDC005914 TaxID=3154572 RepID=UPI0033EE8BF6
MGKKELDLRSLTGAGESMLRTIARLRFADDSTERVLILISTLGEMHVAKSLRVLVERGRSRRGKFESTLVAKTEENMYLSWPSMFEWLSSGFDLHIRGKGPAQAFESCIAMRNAIVHGDGRLTELQARSFAPSVATRNDAVKKLGVHFVGNRVFMGEKTRELVLQAARDFVIYFDAQLLAKYPELLGAVDVEPGVTKNR